MGKYLVILSMIFGFSILYWASLSEPNIIMGENYCRGWTTTTDVRRLTTSQAHAMTSPRTSRMGGALPLLAMNGWGIHVRVHNESSAKCTVNQDQQYASYELGGAILHVHNESSASGQAPEEEGPGRRVQRSQLRLAPPNGIPFV